ncbi:MAG: type II toxin-antitoxin system Phd/YefM family antitoxin [Thermoleophilia bacterium]
MGERTLPISAVKARLLALAEEVATTGEEVVVTKRGRPLVRLVPVDPPDSLRGSVTYHVDEEELIYGRLGVWDVERE